MGDTKKLPSDFKMPEDFKMPSIDEIMKMVDSMKGLTDEHREKLREQFIKRAGFASPFPHGENGEAPAQGVDMIPPATTFELISMALYLIMVLTFLSTFGKL